jgi:hypothetical protein
MIALRQPARARKQRLEAIYALMPELAEIRGALAGTSPAVKAKSSRWAAP